MPYDQKKKQLVGFYDQGVISRGYEMRVSNNRQRLAHNLTEAEKMFKAQVADVLREEYRIHYATQKIFHITDQVAFIADFYFKNFHLAVEIDGPDHRRRKEQARDTWRDGLLHKTAQVQVIRFTNKEILENPTAVFDKTVKAMLAREHATPSAQQYLRRAYQPYR